MKSITKTLLLGFSVLVLASCGSKNDKWYLGEWTDGENTFTLTKTTYSNPGWEEECPITIRETSGGVFIDGIPEEEFGHSVSIDTERQVILFENANSGPYRGAVIGEYHKKGSVKETDTNTRSTRTETYNEPENNQDYYEIQPEPKKEVIFRRSDDVFSYLNKHTFKDEDGNQIIIRPSGVSVSMGGRTQQLSNAVRVSVDSEWAAIVFANTPYNTTLTLIVNCARGLIMDSEGLTFYEQKQMPIKETGVLIELPFLSQ